MGFDVSEQIIPGPAIISNRLIYKQFIHPALLTMAMIAVGLLMSSLAYSAADEKATQGVAKAPELFKLKNDELLKQARRDFHQGLGRLPLPAPQHRHDRDVTPGRQGTTGCNLVPG